MNAFVFSQSPKDVSVELQAVTEKTPSKITIQWVSNDATSQYQVYRKEKSANNWGLIRASLTGTINKYADTTVAAGISYEYKVVRTGNGYTGYGYINSGIGVGAVEWRGKLILLVHSSVIDSMAFYINRLKQDLEGDGWEVNTIIVPKSATCTEVKNQIQLAYNLDKLNTKALFLIGHIPVPYSGNLNPDGHPDHLGAWPADMYYGDMDGSWTDTGVNNITAGDARNRNIPADGKFDQSIIPSDIELQTGRVDFSNMPAFNKNEYSLLKAYLDKDHSYRNRLIKPEKRAVIDDNFGYFSGEAFASSGWRNFSPLTGSENVEPGDYFSSMSGASYLWSYGCGPGSYTSAGGIGSTSNFVNSSLNGIFTILFGSYFGDWDSQNNFLRAPLASGAALTSVWAGRPHWQFHHMGLGENIGYDVKLTQNNSGLYYTHYAGRFVHISLMGDPTLRNDMLSPASEILVIRDGAEVTLKWKPSEDSVYGYHVYRKSGESKRFIRINQKLIEGTSYVDSCLIYPGEYIYMVRAVGLQTTPSGTYFNLSQGVFDTVFNDINLEVKASADFIQSNNQIKFTNTSTNATHYTWIFGDGAISESPDPTHFYTMGTYQTILIASNDCDKDTLYIPLNITTGTKETEINDLIVYPNPITTNLNILSKDNLTGFTEYILLNNLGHIVERSQLTAFPFQIDFSTYQNGIYTLILKNKSGKIYTKKLCRIDP